MAVIGGPMTRDNITDLLELGLRQVFLDQYDLIDNQLETVYSPVPSSKKTETDAMMAGLGYWHQKTEGDEPDSDSGQEAYKVAFTATTWALKIEITEEGMEDDLYDFYKQMGAELGRAGAYTQQVQAFTPWNNLGDTVYTAESTNYPLLSTTHYRVDGGTWANKPTTPTDLSLESLELFLTNWRTNMLDQRGRKFAMRPRKLMVGPADEWVAHRLLESDKRPFSADNDVNAVKERRNLEVFVADFMTDDSRWFLLADVAQTGARYNLRAKREMRRRDDPRTGNLLMVGRYRESHGFAHPYGIYGTS